MVFSQSISRILYPAVSGTVTISLGLRLLSGSSELLLIERIITRFIRLTLFLHPGKCLAVSPPRLLLGLAPLTAGRPSAFASERLCSQLSRYRVRALPATLLPDKGGCSDFPPDRGFNPTERLPDWLECLNSNIILVFCLTEYRFLVNSGVKY